MTSAALLGATLRRALTAPATAEPSPFALPERVWRHVNERVYFVVNARAHGGPYAQFQNMSSFARLEEACRAWHGATFPLLVALSEDVQRYASETVPRLYAELESALAVRATARILVALAYLRTDAVSISQSAHSLAQAAQTFKAANEAADLEFKQRAEGAWLALVPKPAQIAEAVGRLFGTWKAIADDLENAHSAILSHGADSLPTSLDISVARGEWDIVRQEVAGFIAGAKQRILEGSFVARVALVSVVHDRAIYLRSTKELPAAVGERLVVFGVPGVDGRVELLEKRPPDKADQQPLWTYRMKAPARAPTPGWTSITGGTFHRYPSALHAGPFGHQVATVIALAEAPQSRTLVRVGGELSVHVNSRISILWPGKVDGSGAVVNKTLYSDIDGDPIWDYVVDAKFNGPFPVPARWAGMYREE